MKKRLALLLLLISFSLGMHAQYTTIYHVDRDDYDFSQVQATVVSTKEIIEETGHDYKRVVVVYDSYRKEYIGGRGSYIDTRPSNQELKDIIQEAVFDLYSGIFRIRGDKKPAYMDKFNGILGLEWGMTMASAIQKLRTMGITVSPVEDADAYYSTDDVTWNGIRYNFSRYEYLVSNSQQALLTNVVFAKIFDTAQEAKKFREELKIDLAISYGSENIQENIAENKFKEYLVYEKCGKDMRASRVRLSIGVGEGFYCVFLDYNGTVQVVSDLDYK